MAGTMVVDTLKSGTSGPAVFKNTSDVEVGQLCRAWVNFNGVTTASIRASFNVSSVTRTAGGIYTIAFTNAFSDTNFTVVGSARVTGNSGILMPYPDSVSTTSSVAVTSLVSNTGVSTDAAYVYVAIFR